MSFVLEKTQDRLSEMLSDKSQVGRLSGASGAWRKGSLRTSADFFFQSLYVR